jgi:hypothetical protein
MSAMRSRMPILIDFLFYALLVVCIFGARDARKEDVFQLFVVWIRI